MPRTYTDWHWWRASASGRPIVLGEFESLPSSAQAELLSTMSAWLDGTIRFKEVAHLGGGLWELRHREFNNHFRVLFYIEDNICIAVRCCYKNQRKCPPTELKLARQRMNSGCHTP